MKAGMGKRTLSLLLILVLLCGLAPAVLAAGASLSNFRKVNEYPEGQFTDVKDGDWFAEYVEAGYEFGLIKGTSESTYSPDNNITIAQSITLAARLHAIFNTGSESFVQGSPWYQVYVDYAVENGIIGTNEYSNYDAKATRAQFACILAAAFPDTALKKINAVAYGAIPDVTGNEYCGASVYKLYNAGVLTGSDGYGTFHPTNNIKRSEVAAIVTRMADTGLRKTYTLISKTDPAVPGNQTNPPVFDYLIGKVTEIGEEAENGVYRCELGTHRDSATGADYTTFIDYNSKSNKFYAFLQVSAPAYNVKGTAGFTVTRSLGTSFKGDYNAKLGGISVASGTFTLNPKRLGKDDSIKLISVSGIAGASLVSPLLVRGTAELVQDIQDQLLEGSDYSVHDLGFVLK